MAIAPQFQKYLDADYHNLKVAPSEIEVPYPPSDSSHTTRMELEELENIVREAKLPNAIMKVADKDPLRLFYSVAKKKGLDPLKEEAGQWADDWTKLSFEYKLKFKRRRPYEVKKEHDINFIVDRSDTTDSPSYPSGHALMGYGVAEFYKDKYPLMADEWDNVADIIAHSRLQMGVHYPSDVSASKKIVADITGNSKEARLLPHNLRERLRKYIKANPAKAADDFRTIASNMYKELTDSLDTEELLSKFSSDNDLPPLPTISEQDWAKEEHSNTKIPRWFRESAMQEAIADELGFTEDTAPTFHKNEDPELQGANAYYHPGFHEIHYDTGEWTPGVLAHEIGHSTMDISPTAKIFNIGKDLSQAATLPLTLAAASAKVNRASPTLLQGLKATGGLSSKLKTLVQGAKGRGGRWSAGAAALAGLGTLIEEARASSKGYQGIDRLVEEGILSEEQAELSKDTMQGAFGTYLKGFPIELAAGIGGHKLLGAVARKLLPSKARLGLAGTLGALGTAGVLAGHLGGGRDIANSPLFGKVNLFDNPLHQAPETKTASDTLRLYHGSPHSLTTLEPRQPNKGRWGDVGLYGSTNPLVAALYALARNESRGSWGVTPEGKLIVRTKKELNPEGYVYSYDSEDYIPPPEDDPGIGYAAQSSPEILSKEKVYLAQLRDHITRVDDKEKFLEYFKKTSSDQPLLRHRATLLIRDPDTGKILAANNREYKDFNDISPFYFPGGGLYDDEYDTPRTATEEEILEGARREALEELGISLKNPRVINSAQYVLPKKWQDKTLKYRGVPYEGEDEHIVLADKGDIDNSIYNIEGDAFTKGDYYDPQEIYDSLYEFGQGDSQFAGFNRDQAKVIKEHLLAKTSSIKLAKDPRKPFDVATENVKSVTTHDLKNPGEDTDYSKGLTQPQYNRIVSTELQRRRSQPRREYFKGVQEDIDNFRDEVQATYNPTPGTARGVSPSDFSIWDKNKEREDYDTGRQRDYILGDAATAAPYSLGAIKARLSPDSHAYYLQPYAISGLTDTKYKPKYNISAAPTKDGGVYTNPLIVGHEYAHGRLNMDEVEADAFAATTDYNLNDLARWYLYRRENDSPEQLNKFYDKVDPTDPHLGNRERLRLFASRFDNGGMEKTQSLLEKTSAIDLLTGRMGAGKSTLLNKLRDQYDIVEGTDLGSVVGGKFVEPSDEDKPRLRQEKADRLLAAHQAGKRVLMEGYPPGLFRIPGMVEAADRAVILEPDLLQRLMQIGNRSKERGTSIEEDIRFAVSPEHSAKEQKYLDMLRESITGTHVAPTSEAAEEYLLKKNASDLSVLTAVPTQNLDLIMRKGLYSQKAMLDDPEVMAAFLAQRNADKAWKNDEQYDEKRFREQYDKRLELLKGRDASLAGPSVFFTEPDPDKVSDPRHFINKFDTQNIRVNLAKLLQDIPDTRIQGSELIPVPDNFKTMPDEEWDELVKQRTRDLTPEEVEKYIATDPKDLWKHYKDEYVGRLYAGDVPHAHIRTPSGIIPPEYLERVEKTSSAKEQLKHILVTGHSGAGKTTYARQLAEELGMPLHELDPRAMDVLAQDYPDHGGIGWPGDLSERVVREALALDAPHVIEGTQIHDVPYLGADLRRILVDTPEDRVIEQRAAREYEKRKLKNKPHRPMEGHRDAARKLVDYYRDSIDNFRNQPGVESIVPEVKQAALEDEFLPDLTPDDLKALGVYDQVYGDAPSEASMKEWPEHWINKQDPLGWLQWYDRYSEGRRTDDDERQIKRWKSFKARHFAQYLKKPTPRRAAALRNWGINVKDLA